MPAPLNPLPLEHLNKAARAKAEDINRELAELANHRERYEAARAEFLDAEPPVGKDYHEVITDAMNAEIAGRHARLALVAVEMRVRTRIAEFLTDERHAALQKVHDQVIERHQATRERLAAALAELGWQPDPNAQPNPGQWLQGMLQVHPEMVRLRNERAGLQTAITACGQSAQEHRGAVRALKDEIAALRKRVVE